MQTETVLINLACAAAGFLIGYYCRKAREIDIYIERQDRYEYSRHNTTGGFVPRGSQPPKPPRPRDIRGRKPKGDK